MDGTYLLLERLFRIKNDLVFLRFQDGILKCDVLEQLRKHINLNNHIGPWAALGLNLHFVHAYPLEIEPLDQHNIRICLNSFLNRNITLRLIRAKRTQMKRGIL